MRLKGPVKHKIIFIVGPTATGKTDLSIKLARLIKGEIISCDSMQVYRGMEILSQAPSSRDRRKAPHHLIGILDPRREYSAASFRKRALDLIRSIIERKRIPIITGGSGLYAKALVDGLFPSPPADIKFRRKMQAFALRHGSARLHQKLAAIDPDSARTIHPNDTRRIIRALEIYHSTTRTMTELKSRTKGLGADFDVRMFGLNAPREELYARIESRVDRMFERGVVAEVKKLKEKKLSKTARSVLGFKEISDYLNGRYGLEEAKAFLKRNTRRFAKRQLTWFKADNRIIWHDISKNDYDSIVRDVVSRLGIANKSRARK
ncbi:MAG: tRNA (adenosine(37)-N6)-dimethylallyltransferase MiaA [Candidatus Omnitrophica bacterium]|nr:tRNA (adenosine(37)-N6)-dimethylallyltransferase MiaA [Candidatus Omnitrophota bacterium]MCM8790680.1 tRNA (adenosine(37)-N6)-dimethylallyltransferase MiaA [Candidatus Omnitrophota bacterium]